MVPLLVIVIVVESGVPTGNLVEGAYELVDRTVRRVRRVTVPQNPNLSSSTLPPHFLPRAAIVPDEKVLALFTIWALKPAKVTAAVVDNATTATTAATRPAKWPVILLDIAWDQSPFGHFLYKLFGSLNSAEYTQANGPTQLICNYIL